MWFVAQDSNIRTFTHIMHNIYMHEYSSIAQIWCIEVVSMRQYIKWYNSNGTWGGMESLVDGTSNVLMQFIDCRAIMEARQRQNFTVDRYITLNHKLKFALFTIIRHLQYSDLELYYLHSMSFHIEHKCYLHSEFWWNILIIIFSLNLFSYLKNRQSEEYKLK